MVFNSQFTFHVDDNGYRYLEYREDIGTKTNQGGLKHKKVFGKVVNIYPSPDHFCCPISVFEAFMTSLPPNHKCPALYLRPKVAYTCANYWYINAPVGVNKLQSAVKNICSQAGFKGNFTNHSLTATCATHMYHNGIDEQVISEVTGNRSLSVRSYKHTCTEQKCMACECLYNHF